eukprot:gene3410-13453_t
MFSRRVFGGTPDTFKLRLEYGPAFSEYELLGTTQAANEGRSEGGVPLPVPVAVLEFDFNSDEPETTIVERFVQKTSYLLLERIEQRVSLLLKVCEEEETEQNSGIARASTFGAQPVTSTICTVLISPSLRVLQLSRTSASGTASETVLQNLLKHCDLHNVWKVSATEGFGNFWTSDTAMNGWENLRNLNLSNCSLTTIPATIGLISKLKTLRLSHNKLISLPNEVSNLTDLEVLALDYNLLTAIPPELKSCCSLKELNLEGNKLAKPVLDLRLLTSLETLNLFGNPLEYLPELSPCTLLRSLSLANVRIIADAGYTSHKLAPLFQLTFRRSSLQHPLLAGALGN